MARTEQHEKRLHTSVGSFPLEEYRLRVDSREWSILHTGATLTYDDELTFLNGRTGRLPYGVALWPSAIALAHDLAGRAGELAGRTVPELGAGTGLPGIVTTSAGARVVQTDRQSLALTVCRRNGARNAAAAIEYRLADWERWTDVARYDWILGADILYGRTMHPHLRGIFAATLADGGRVLLADPFREPSLRMLEAMEADGWTVSVSKWSVAAADEARPIGVFELTRRPAA